MPPRRDLNTLPLGQRAPTVLGVTSADIEPRTGKTYIVLYWNGSLGYASYKLYRSPAGQDQRTYVPLNNNAPIASVKSCDELTILVPPAIEAWEMLANAFWTLQNKNLKTPVWDLNSLLNYLCAVFERGLTGDEEKLFDIFATFNLDLRIGHGFGYLDHDIQAHQNYMYMLTGFRPDGTEVTLVQDVPVRAGEPTLPTAPSGFTAEAGDNQVLLSWNRNPDAFSYVVSRSTDPYQIGVAPIINEHPILFDLQEGLEGQKIDPPRPGFVDFQRWNNEGYPTWHIVNGQNIFGPQNDTAYYYQVAALDILGRKGSWSATQSATPRDQTPPMAVTEVKVDPSLSPLGLGCVDIWDK